VKRLALRHAQDLGRKIEELTAIRNTVLKLAQHCGGDESPAEMSGYCLFCIQVIVLEIHTTPPRVALHIGIFTFAMHLYCRIGYGLLRRISLHFAGASAAVPSCLGRGINKSFPTNAQLTFGA
jgi:hypothetical protein